MTKVARVRRLNVVANGYTPLLPSRTCGVWSEQERLRRDLTLAGFMQWAWHFYRVELKLLCRGEHVAVCELLATRPGQGRAHKVMTELCEWADCAGIPLELTPSGQWGADVDRLTIFYISLSFEPNCEPAQRFLVQESMIRYPVEGGGHERCRA